jgi:hypothetical protein
MIVPVDGASSQSERLTEHASIQILLKIRTGNVPILRN